MIKLSCLRYGSALCGVMMISATVAHAVVTDELFLHVDPKLDAYGHLAVDLPLTLVWQKPEGASSARLTLSCGGRQVVYENLTGTSIEIGDAPTVDADERVWDLALAFDDPSQTVRSARLAFLRSACTVRKEGTRYWHCADSSSVLPVPAGATDLTVNGVSVPQTVLDGTPNWFWTQPGVSSPVAVTMNYGGKLYSTDVRFGANGMVLILR